MSGAGSRNSPLKMTEKVDNMFHGYDPELAALLSAETDPARAGGSAPGISVWGRVQGLLVLAIALVLAALLLL